MTMLTADRLNKARQAEFVASLDGVYEHSPWIAEAAWARRPFSSLAALKVALAQVVREAPADRQLALIRAHPELAGKAMVAQALTAESSGEQQAAGLTRCTPEEFDTLQRLNAAYNGKFGFPFILAVRGPRGLGLTRREIIETFTRRLDNTPAFERAECLRQIHRIAEIRLNDKFGVVPLQGRQAWDCAELLAQHSDVEEGVLTVTYLTHAHRACQAQLLRWMHDCGFDETRIDAVGNVVGVYWSKEESMAGRMPSPGQGRDGEGSGLFRPATPVRSRRLLTGSHYDTVRNAGKYDGRLGIFVPMIAVRELHRAGRRLPFGIELVGFAEEEGQRYAATFLGSSALTGGFDPAWLDQVDADGIAMRDAMLAAGLPGTLEAIAAERRDPARYLGFVEVHIEQGPVLNELDLPLGIVTSINGSRRFLGEVIGTASHAGTTPMDRRHDAALAVAELALAVEQAARREPDRVGTVGMLQVPHGSINVVPGRCQFSLDLRAPTDAARDVLTEEVLAALAEIAGRRGLRYRVNESLRAAAAPSAPDWQARWETAVRSLGLPLHRLPSGAGHDAMKLHQVMPQAMLFVRGGNSGISHNPLEAVTDDDAQLAVDAFAQLLEGLA
jgi:N-carbamoyl-L-amino-acid hydrolase